MPGTMRSDARYVRETAAPPLFMLGPKCCSIETYEYDDALRAAKYPCSEIHHRRRSGLATSVPVEVPRLLAHTSICTQSAPLHG